MRSLLRNLQGEGVFDVIFGGSVADDGLHLSEFSGTRSRVLRGLVIEAGRGAGGRALVEHRPVRVDHYRTTRAITHDYLRQITREGIQALVASPISVKGAPRGILYGALRRSVSLGDRSAEALEKITGALSYELAVQEEVEFRLQTMSEAATDAGVLRSPRLSESITENYLELREIAEAVDDPEMRDRIRRVQASLRSLTEPRSDPGVHLTVRETDVLLYAGVGCSNAEIGERLSLSATTVKTYMRNLMAKLDVSSRHAAVVEARRRGLIP